MVELNLKFVSYDEGIAWSSDNRTVFMAEAAREMGDRILAQGLTEPLTGLHFPPDAIRHEGGNWREGLNCGGITSRVRAVMKILGEVIAENNLRSPAIFATEAVTVLALKLRGLYPRFLGSEYLPDDASKRRLYPIPHQDLMALDLPSASFDIVTTNEVLEHVPDLDVCLKELHRVLKPGGWHVGTHPFRLMDKDSDKRAVIEDGQVVHLKSPPEYHGNPVDPAGGSLVFETPGWDIVERAKAAGFSEVHMRFVASETHGILTENTGVFVFCAKA